MFNRALLSLLFGIVVPDMNSAQRHVSIEQTEVYKDTWTNMNLTCSLLGTGRMGDMLKNKVTLDHINNMEGTGWISAHVEHHGTLKFLGCIYGHVHDDTSGLEVAQDRIPECIYFCESSEIFLHRNRCYCKRNVHLQYVNCLAKRCGKSELVFCGQSVIPSSKCMCHYKYLSVNLRNTLTQDFCHNDNINCTLVFRHFRDSNWHGNCKTTRGKCQLQWNGYVTRKEFYWGTSSPGISNHEYCIAIRKVNTRLTLITLPCSSKQNGICINGTRISTTRQTTQQPTVIHHTTERYEPNTSELVSHKISEHTTNDFVTNPDSTINYDTNTVPHTFSLPDTNPNPDATTMMTRINITSGIDGVSMKNDQTNILGPILGSVGAFVVLVIAGVIIIVLVKKSRRHADARSKPSQELKTLSTSKQHQNQYVNHNTEHQGGGHQDTGEYDSPTTSRTKSKNAVYDLYDHTSGTGDNMYGRLNQNGRGNESPENADIYDHSRAVVQVNGDTYDSFQTGVSREDCSADYYDHTPVGEDYGYLEKGGNRKDQVDDIYDHARENGHVDGGTYDIFQKGRGRDDASEDCYDHTGVSAEYGYLQKGH